MISEFRAGASITKMLDFLALLPTEAEAESLDSIPFIAEIWPHLQYSDEGLTLQFQVFLKEALVSISQFRQFKRPDA